MILEIINAEFKYDFTARAILKNINIKINPGKIYCILGPNGVGKTSLLKCIAGLFKLSKGKILYNGKDILSKKRINAARIMAYVPQIHYPVFAYSVFDTVLMGRTPYLGFFSFPDLKDETIAAKAIKSLGISHLADTPYTEISGGERQLVMFARALAQEPEILILDEPCSHLDYGNQVRILSLIHDLAKTGTAVIMTSHNPDHAFMIADKTGIMFNQSIEKFDIPMDIITEEKLSEIYGIKVKLRQDNIFGKICVPTLNQT